MSNCILCHAPVSVLTQRKIENGVICKDCAAKVPSVIRGKLSNYYDLELKTIIDKMQFVKERNDKFIATASYGKLHIDEVHGLFAVSDKVNADGVLSDTSSIFYCLALTEVGLYCTDPTAQKGKVTCNVEFSCSMSQVNIAFKTRIKTGANCDFKKEAGNQLSWSEPGDLSLFRSMFNQMIATEAEKLRTNYSKRFETQATLDLFRAETLFMLDGEYTEEDVKKMHNRLAKAFHPDTTDIDERYMQIINFAYEVLMANLR
jgi:hypothetical protein